MAACAAAHVAPAVALENENLRDALRARDAARVREILETEF